LPPLSSGVFGVPICLLWELRCVGLMRGRLVG
jgi:hypothetical protein